MCQDRNLCLSKRCGEVTKDLVDRLNKEGVWRSEIIFDNEEDARRSWKRMMDFSVCHGIPILPVVAPIKSGKLRIEYRDEMGWGVEIPQNCPHEEA